MEDLGIIGYWMSIFGLTSAFSKFYVGKWLRETISRLTDKQFKDDVGTDKEECQWDRWQCYIGRLVRCTACAGFWIGLALAIPYQVLYSDWAIEFGFHLGEMILKAYFMALSASAFNIIGWMILEKLGIMGDKK